MRSHDRGERPGADASSSSDRFLALLGPAVLVVSTTLLVVATALHLRLDPAEPMVDALGWSFSWLGFGAVGAVVVLRRPRNRVGWVLCAITLAIGTALCSDSLAAWMAATGVGPAWLGEAALLTSASTTPSAFVLILVLLVIFPDGDLPTGRMRRVFIAMLVLLAADTVAWVLQPLAIDATDVGGRTLRQPLGVLDASVMESVTGALGVGLAGLGLIVLANLIWRARHADGIRRLQFRWLTRSVLVLPSLFIAGLLTGVVVGDAADVFDLGDYLILAAFVFGLTAIAVAIGVAVLRHRLYEIDRIVSRTLSYSIVTGVLGGIYVLGVLGIGALFPGEPSDLLVATSTLFVAALFRPVRSRVQSAVDHRFNRSRVAADEAAEAFRSRLRDEVDLAAAVDDLAVTVHRALRPSSLSVWLAPTD